MTLPEKHIAESRARESLYYEICEKYDDIPRDVYKSLLTDAKNEKVKGDELEWKRLKALN